MSDPDDSERENKRKAAMVTWARAVLAARNLIDAEAYDALRDEDGAVLEVVERLALHALDSSPVARKVVETVRGVVRQRGDRDVRIAHASALVAEHAADPERLVEALSSVDTAFMRLQFELPRVAELLQDHGAGPAGRQAGKLAAVGILAHLNIMAGSPFGENLSAQALSQAVIRARKKHITNPVT